NYTSQRRLVTKAFIISASFKNIYFLYKKKENHRCHSSLSIIRDNHLMFGLVYVYAKSVLLRHHDVETLSNDGVVQR
ncbi:unnamed protein product, partial [Rotaria socialis]